MTLHTADRMSAAEYRKQMGLDGPAEPKRDLKYGNKPVMAGGERFASQKEYNHHMILVRRLGEGTIRNLRHEPPYQCVVNGALICTIKPDHVFEEKTETGGWRQRYVDTKSSATITPLFKLKKKLFEALFGVELEIWD